MKRKIDTYNRCGITVVVVLLMHLKHFSFVILRIIVNSCTSLSFAKATNTLKEIQDQMNILTECGTSTESFVGNSERTMKDFEAILS